MTARKLKEYLDERSVQYRTIEHSPTYTTAEAAATAHVSGHMVAKTVVLDVDDRMVMVVVPANAHVDMDIVKETLKARSVELATEIALTPKFPGCEFGALPPFGELYDMPVYIDPELTEHEDIAFNAGTHTELIRMAYRDFERFVKPEVLPAATYT